MQLSRTLTPTTLQAIFGDQDHTSLAQSDRIQARTRIQSEVTTTDNRNPSAIELQ